MLSVITYRLVRLRRLIAITVIPSLLFVMYVVPLSAEARFWSAAIVLFCLIGHVMRYPKVWSETVNLAVTVCLSIFMFGLLNDHAAIQHLPQLLRLMAFGVVGVTVFFMLTYASIQGFGKARPGIVTASRVSSLEPEFLRQSLPLRPGQSRKTVVSGPLANDGCFPFTYKNLDDSYCATADDNVDTFPSLGRSRVVTDEPGLVKVISFMADSPQTSASIYRFESCRGGTMVTLQENSDVLTLTQWLGFWLQDYMTDYLIDELDALEGRPQRANRSFPNRMLIADIARLFPQGLEGPDSQL